MSFFDKLAEMYREVFGIKVTRLADKIFDADCILKPFDKRLPLQVIPGLCNVEPWGTDTTQISTDNWPSGKNSFFLELEGTWWKPPAEDVKILDGDGETNGLHLRNLSIQERKEALHFVIDHWPITPHVRRIS